MPATCSRACVRVILLSSALEEAAEQEVAEEQTGGFSAMYYGILVTPPPYNKYCKLQAICAVCIAVGLLLHCHVFAALEY